MRHYTSFTSPIRKYADLTVHRQVTSLLCSKSAHLDISLQSAARFDEFFMNRAEILNAHEANHAAFKKAVENMFSVVCGSQAQFIVSVDQDRAKVSVSAVVDSLRIYRDLSKNALLDDRITIFGQPVHSVKRKQVPCQRTV